MPRSAIPAQAHVVTARTGVSPADIAGPAVGRRRRTRPFPPADLAPAGTPVDRVESLCPLRLAYGGGWGVRLPVYSTDEIRTGQTGNANAYLALPRASVRLGRSDKAPLNGSILEPRPP
jgi:hypothetical protein